MIGKCCKDSDVIWLAGLFDGEGHVRITKSKYTYKNKYSERYCYGLACKINMVHKETIDHVKSILGCGTVYQRSINNKHPEWRTQWGFDITGSNAYQLLKSIQSYSVTKRKEIDLAIEYYEKFVLNKKSKNARLSTEHRLEQDRYFLKMQELKQYEYTT